MSPCSYFQRVITTNLLTLYYTLKVIFMLALGCLIKPFSNPWALKLKLVPPARLTDPKYGVHKYIKVNNTVLHYVESGDSSKPLMIFLHGFPEFWYSWRHQIVDFQKDYWCIAVDMRGYGDSERPENVASYKIELLIEDVRDLIRQLGREKCILISHDWGGLIACRFRDIYPDVSSAIIVLASVSMAAWSHEIWTNPKQRQKSWYVFLYRVPLIPELMMSFNDLVFYDKIMLFPDKKSTDAEDVECYKYWFRKPYALTSPLNYYRANFTPANVPAIEEHKENVPMLVAHAANDLFLDPNMLETMKKQYACIETTIVAGAGHFLQQEEPEKVNILIRDFLSRHNL